MENKRPTLKMPDWGSIPLLPLSCILKYLTTKDALSAMSTCRHWRNAILLYEGHKETLKLQAKQLERSLFLARIFRRHTHKLFVHLDCNDDKLDKFTNFVLPLFLDTERLYELVFIGPAYVQQNSNLTTVKLNRIITETLIFKHQRYLCKFALLDCALDAVKNDDDILVHRQVEYYSRSLNFNKVPFSGDTILSRCNAYAFVYYHLQHIICDYDQVSTECLSTLSNISTLRLISLIVSDGGTWAPVDWSVISGVQVGINIISLPYKRFEEVMYVILVEDLPLVSLKVMFCDVLCPRLLRHISSLYKTSLREVVWVDLPFTSSAGKTKPTNCFQQGPCNVNPFVLLCWQCNKLSRLVIHGYWIWHYDLLGVVRLASTIRLLEVSSVNTKQGRTSVTRVLATDVYMPLHAQYLASINAQAEWPTIWRPLRWTELHPGLRTRTTRDQRTNYIVREIRGDITKYT